MLQGKINSICICSQENVVGTCLCSYVAVAGSSCVDPFIFMPGMTFFCSDFPVLKICYCGKWFKTDFSGQPNVIINSIADNPLIILKNHSRS